MAILAVNAGSSSLKLSLIADDDRILAERELEAPGAQVDPEQLEAALADGLDQAEAVVHRIVHGGERFTGPVLIDDEVTDALEQLTDLAPLHQPKSLAALHAVSKRLPDVPAIACFDTAFHQTLSPAASDLSTPGPLARALGPAQVRLPRPVARLDRAAGCRSCVRSCRIRRGSSPATWAPAPRCARSQAVARSTRRWDSPRSTDW